MARKVTTRRIVISTAAAWLFGFLIFLWALRSPKSWRRWGVVGSAGGLGILIFGPATGGSDNDWETF